MIEELRLINWKSYGDSTLYIEPLTFVIGFNASGKSNVLDALSFLTSLSKGNSIDDAARDVRGGEEWVIRTQASTTTLAVKIHDNDSETDYLYEIEIGRRDSNFEVCREKLVKEVSRANIVLLDTEATASTHDKFLPLTSYTGKPTRRKIAEVSRERMALIQVSALNVRNEVKEGVAYVLNKLRNIFILNPIASLMRNYAPMQKELKQDASNIAGVIAGLDDIPRTTMLSQISNFVRNLPEKDITEIWTEKVGMFGKDAMLYCKERWTNDSGLVLDARGMSDGTLRFIAIITALLTLPSGTLLLIEEVDNGLHPSRAGELIAALKKIGQERSIDVICTTHNPYLIDALGTELIPCISYIKRDEKTGYSNIYPLDENENLFNIMATGSIGAAMAKGKI